MDAQGAIDLCDSILDAIEELPERACDFGESVQEKVESIKEWIEENDHVTDAQITALENMAEGVGKWMEG